MKPKTAKVTRCGDGDCDGDQIPKTETAASFDSGKWLKKECKERRRAMREGESVQEVKRKRPKRKS